jgi:bifunctional UDP-N-acetylglucosamine pyrophosphorylase / glucosamine-1-phosphate N-acetyltransferase
MRTSLAVVLAAGEGKRMKSRLPKVLHPIGAVPMLVHVLAALRQAGIDRLAVVIGPGHEAVADLVAKRAPGATVHVQSERRGTADAVKTAREALQKKANDVLVVYADTPFVSAAAISRLREKLAGGASVVFGGMRPGDPSGYGRLIMQGDQLVAIREHRDATEEERKSDSSTVGSWVSPARRRFPFSTPSRTGTTRRNST